MSSAEYVVLAMQTLQRLTASIWTKRQQLTLTALVSHPD